jgi:spore germination cell wall hydrolase CwlJ-like protein
MPSRYYVSLGITIFFTKYFYLRVPITFILALLPIFVASSSRPFLGVLLSPVVYSEEVLAISRVVWREARGEPIEGQKAVVHAIRNRAIYFKEDIVRTTYRGMKRGKLDNKIVEMVSKEMERPIQHSYIFWLNPKTATDTGWVKYARGRRVKLIGRHWFFK